MTRLRINIFQSVEEAPNYSKIDEYRASNLIEASVIRKGTQNERSSVDLVFVDEKGRKFVAMTTGKIIRMLAQTIGEEN